VSEAPAFAERYGPWAIVAGASEGVGRALARRVAANGVNCILVARREQQLAELAEQIRAESGVECIPASIDLAAPDAFDRIVATAGSREVGLYVSNAGADPNASHFLDRKIETWIELVNLNVLTTMRCCHHFGGLMRERRRGGLLLVGSGAAYGGGPFMATYSGAKAFDLCFGESLWAELRPFGVDVLCLVLVITDTPALRKLLEAKGQPLPSRMASPAHVAEVGLARLPLGPVYNWGPLPRFRAGWRRTRVRVVARLSRKVFGADSTVRGNEGR
jgi:short-subunit dehydrogenase